MNAIVTRIKWESQDDADTDLMEFRLTYSGLLLGASKSHTRSAHKHEIRRVFHKQLKRLWKVDPHLGPDPGPDVLTASSPAPIPATTIEELAQRFDRNGYNFVPLVTQELSLRCDISILFLRPDPPGSVLKSGDIDNRVKTLFDALRMPSNRSEIGSQYVEPNDDERPFFVLLEDDKLITSVSVETDMLLEPISDQQHNTNDARIIITVKVSPHRLSMYNMHLG